MKKDYMAQVQSDRGSNSWPLDHEQIMNTPETCILDTEPSGIMWNKHEPHQNNFSLFNP